MHAKFCQAAASLLVLCNTSRLDRMSSITLNASCVYCMWHPLPQKHSVPISSVTAISTFSQAFEKV